MKYIFSVLGISIIAIVLALGISSLIFWGLGNLIIWVFNINYIWTIWHGLVCALAFALLKELFDRK